MIADLSLQEQIAELVAMSPGGSPPHPAPNVLIDYHRRRLDEAAVSSVRRHLVACRACAAALVDLAAMESAGEEDSFGVDDAAAQDDAIQDDAPAWQALQPLLAVDSSPAENSAIAPGFVTKTGTHGRFAKPTPWMALVAALVLTSVGLGLWNTQLQRQKIELLREVDTLGAPDANAPVLYLDALTRNDPKAPFEVPASARRLMIFITVPQVPAAEIYRVDVFNAAGVIQLSVGSLEVQDLGALRFSLATSGLETGDYRLRLFAQGIDAALAEYDVRLGGAAEAP